MDKGGIRKRSHHGLIVGSMCSLIIGLLAPWSIYVMRGSYMALDYSTPAAIGLFFVLVLIGRWLHMAKRDMVIAYTMMVVACAVPTGGLITPFLALSTGHHYYSNSGNKWASLVSIHLPVWASPRAEYIVGLYEGGTFVPWEAWLLPLVCWFILFAALYTVMACCMALLQKQWIEHERLNYPLTVLPIALIEGSIFQNWRFWVGCAIPAIVGISIGLHFYFPAIPVIQHVFGSELLLPLRISFPMIGFFYLVGLPASLSLWLFTLAGELLHRGLVMTGLPATMKDMPYGADSIFAMYVGAGAVLAMVGIRLNAAQKHLTGLWRTEQRLFTLTGIGLAVMIVWLAVAGIPLLIAAILVFFAVVIFIAMTRIVAETGLAVAVAPAIAPVLTVGLMGKGVIGASGIASMAQSFVWTSEGTRVSAMASMAHSLKLAAYHKQREPALWQYMGLAIALSAGMALWFTLTYGYKHGLGSHWFFSDSIRYVYGWAADWNAHRYGPSIIGWVLVIGGGLLYGMLSKHYLLGGRWALHPVGLTVAGTYFMRLMWLSCFLSWLMKKQILHWWGAKGYESLKPVFLGMICGQYVTNLIWLGIDRLTGHTGNMIFWV